MLFQNNRNKLLFVSVLVLATSSATCAGLITLQTYTPAETGEIEYRNITLTPATGKNRICCKTALCQMDKYHAGLVDECLRESIERHLLACPHCANVYQCEIR